MSTNTHLAKQFEQIILSLGEDITRDGLTKTPERAARALTHLTRGYQQDINDIVNDALFESNINEMILIKDIEFYSLCEHHLLPFLGKCHIAYLPNNKVLGLSKFGRIIDLFAQRLQMQENLTQQIANAVLDVTGAKGVGVIIDAKHLCMMMRGIQKQNSEMRTSVMLGSFRDDPQLRNEFLQLL